MLHPGVPPHRRLQVMVSDLDTIAKMARRVRHASDLLRVGLRGVDDEHDDPFSLKERRQVKITKIGLTRSSSTPSNPSGSRAEA